MFKALRDDFKAALDNDPAVSGFWGATEILLTYAGFHVMISHRFAHALQRLGIPFIPRAISQIARIITGIEIHPGAEIGPGFFVDHGSGVVVGETAIVGKNCMLFQGVTLGGTGKETGKRHPTLGDNVMVSAGAKVLGNITVGDHCKVGAMSVVLKDVPPHCTVVGVPGRVVIREGVKVEHGFDLNHQLPDPVAERFALLQKEIDCLHRMMPCSEEAMCELLKAGHTGEFSPSDEQPTGVPGAHATACGTSNAEVLERIEKLETALGDLRQEFSKTSGAAPR